MKEYKFVLIHQEKDLNDMSAKGWELMPMPPINGYHVFSRERVVKPKKAAKRTK
jgi:hypothetical protein